MTKTIDLGDQIGFNAYYNSAGYRIRETIYQHYIHRYNLTTHKDSIVQRIRRITVQGDPNGRTNQEAAGESSGA